MCVSDTKHYAICLEPGFYPDTPNHPSFPSSTLLPHHTYTHHTVFSFFLLFRVCSSKHATLPHYPQYENTVGYHGVRTQKHKKYSVKQIPKTMMYLLISFSPDSFASRPSHAPTLLPTPSSSRIALHAHPTTTPHTPPPHPRIAPVTRPSTSVCWFWPCVAKRLQPRWSQLNSGGSLMMS